MHLGTIANNNPDKPAYIMAESGQVFTYRQLEDGSNQGAQLFRQLGLKRGDHIAILHRGSILADGTLASLLDAHSGDDLEQVFFDLISQHDKSEGESNTLPAGSAGAGA